MALYLDCFFFFPFGCLGNRLLLEKNITRHVLFYWILFGRSMFWNVLLKPLLCWEIDRKTRGENRDSTWYANTVGTNLRVHLHVIYWSYIVWCVCVCLCWCFRWHEWRWWCYTKMISLPVPLWWKRLVASETFVLSDYTKWLTWNGNFKSCCTPQAISSPLPKLWIFSVL